MRRFAVLLLLLLSCAACAEVTVQVQGIWFETDARGGRVHYELRTNLPDRAILEVSLESRFDTVAGPLVRAVASSRVETADGAANGTFDSLSASLPPGKYVLHAELAENQRAPVREAIGEQAPPPFSQEAFLGSPSALVAWVCAEVEQFKKDIDLLDATIAALDQRIAAYNAGKWDATAVAEFKTWREASQRQLVQLMERAGRYHDKLPTHMPEAFRELSDVGMNLRDTLSELGRASGEGSDNDRDPPRAPGEMNTQLVTRLLREVKFKFAWEVCYEIAELPEEIASAAAPDTGLLPRAQWDACKRDLEQAVRGLPGLTKLADLQVKEPTIRVAGVEAPLAAATSEAPSDGAAPRRAVAAQGLPADAAVAKSLLALIKAADSEAKTEGVPLPAGLRKVRDDFLAAQGKVCKDLAAAYK